MTSSQNSGVINHTRGQRALWSCLIGATLLVALPVFGLAQGTAKTNRPIPLIVMDEVPLEDAIKNLARQAELNFIIDPRITATSISADGQIIQRPNVSFRWENLTAEQALERILTEQKLKRVQNPATSVMRIVPSNHNQPAVSSLGVGKDTNSPVARIEMDNVPLDEAIKKLAAEAKLNVVLDPRLFDPSFGPPGRTLPRSTISLHWENLTPRQALAALLDNYDLTLTEDGTSPTARIAIKSPVDRPSASPLDQGKKPGKE